MKVNVLWVVVYSLIIFPCICSGEVLYEIEDLGTYTGDSMSITDINNSGQVIGESSTSGEEGSGERSWFFWSEGSFRELEGIPGYGEMLYDLNDSGQIAGYYHLESEGKHGFIWQDGAFTDIGFISDNYSRAYSINERGQVTGVTHIADSPDPRGNSRAFLWEDGAMISLGTLGGWTSSGKAINDLGQIAGQSYISSGKNHAFVWEDGVMTDITPAGYVLSGKIDINNEGQVIGLAQNDHPSIWDNGTMIDMGTLGGSEATAESINNLGQVVGQSEISTDSDWHAFIWDGESMLDLNDMIDPDSGWDFLMYANGINDHGQIAGTGLVDGQLHGYVLTPIPEPCTVLLMGLGGGLLFKRFRA